MCQFLLLFCLGLCPSLAVAQSPSGPAFEVASIHVRPPNQKGKIGFYGAVGGGVELGACDLATLVGYALDVDDTLISGIPDRANKVYYDIKATPPGSSPSRKLNLSGYTATPTPEQREMILNLLVERFGFRYHVEKREMPAYFLERGKKALRLSPPKYPERTSDPRGGLVMRGALYTGEGFGQSLSMDDLARALAWPLERPVVNRTGVTGIYDFHVDPIDPENQDKVRGALLMTEALGLKLVTGRAPIRTIHVDASTPPKEN